MRELKYAILGLINRAPITGYDIMKEFGDRTLANFWHAKHSQIYPELQKLTQEGSVEFEIIIQGEKMEKKLYHITEQGRADFLNWLVQDTPMEATPKDPFRLRSYFSESIPKERYLALLHTQKEQHNMRLSYLNEAMSNHFPENIPPKIGSPTLGDYLVLRGAIIREEASIEWLDECIDLYLK